MSQTERTKVFISYSHEDRSFLNRLKVFLKPLERNHKIDLWDDSKILSGTDWREEIANAIASCKVAVLLVSADFMASDFIDTDELPPLLDAAETDGAVILPVIVGIVDYPDSKLAKFQTVNDPERPLIDLPRNKRERVFFAVQQRIKDLMRTAAVKVVETRASDTEQNQNSKDGANEIVFGIGESAEPVKPRFLAEFVPDNEGKIHDGYGNYDIRLFIENAPPETEKVVYELHETYIEPINEVTDKSSNFELEIASYGDYVVNIEIHAGKISEMNVWLTQALKNFYGTNADDKISRAIERLSKR